MKIKNFKKIISKILVVLLLINNLLFFQSPYFAQESTDSSQVVNEPTPTDQIIQSTVTPTQIIEPTITSTPVTPTQSLPMTAVPTSQTTIEALENFIKESSSSAEILIDHKIKLPFIGNYPISLGFGETPDALYLQKEYELFGIVAHNGIDYELPESTEILTTDRGIVLSAGPGMYGTTVVIFHQWGLSYYGHLSKTAVEPGQVVETGELIGYSGQTGLATGPHLHFSIKPKNPNFQNGYHGMIDPNIYIDIKPQSNILGEQINLLNEKNKRIKSFTSDEKAEIEIKIKDLNLQYELKDFSGKKINFNKKIFKEANKNRLFIDQPKDFRPGKYTLEVTNDLGEIEKQEFYWGVLVINTNKSIYLPGEIGYFQMAALRDDGHTLCNTNLKLVITTPDNIIFTPEIKNSSECGGNNITEKPDYFVYQKLDAVGVYKISLFNLDNDFQIDDQFEVRETVPFEIERVGATRINPFKSDYTMTIKIKANEDFNGEIKETIPENFKVINSNISWNINLSKGEEKTLSYTYRAPKISPEIFILGPLTIGSFTESKSWQLASDADPGWYNSAWVYRTKLTIDYTKVTANQTDFPVYVNLNNLHAGFHSHVNQTDARDIRVTKDDGTTELPREVVFYTAASDTGELHFKYTGTLSSTVDTDVYIYYGNASASDYAVTDTYGRNNVWTNGYVAVYHLKETSGQHASSTGSNDSDSVSVNQQGANIGQIYQADDFVTNHRVNVPDVDGLSINTTNQLTAEAWAKLDSLTIIPRIISKGGVSWTGYEWQLRVNSGGDIVGQANTSAGGDYMTAAGSSGAVVTGTWYHLAVVYNFSTPRTETFKNGVSNASDTTTSGSYTNGTGPFRIGEQPSGDYDVDGIIDEVRISSTARASTWLLTQYNNQNSPSTFFSSFGTETTNTPTNDQLMRHGGWFLNEVRQTFTF